MSNVYLSLTDVITFGVLYTLENGDFLYVDDLAVVGSIDLQTVQGVGTGASTLIAGDLVSLASTASTLDFASAPDTTVTLVESGSVWGAGSATLAAIVGGAGFRLISDGVVQAPYGIGVSLNGAAGSIDNRGSISGGSTGVRLNGPDQTLLNYGTIAGGTTPAPDATYGHAVQISGTGAVVSNWGDISATAPGGSAINVAGAGGPALASIRVENHGTMTALRGVAVDASENTGVGITLINTGTVSGAGGAFVGSNGASVVINSGTLIGNLTFGSGADLYDGRGRSLADRVFGGSGNDTLTGGVYGDYLVGDFQVDSLTGGGGDDSLYGGQSTDVLRGSGDDDLLFGGTHNDSLFGGNGDDTLVGETDLDILNGGAGVDTFRFLLSTHSLVGASRDRIVDFRAEDDILDLTGFLAGGTFIGEAAFGNIARQVRYTATSGIVAADIDGNGTADFEVRLSNRPAVLTDDNFLL